MNAQPAAPLRAGARGQALVEFALVSVLIVLLLGGVIEFGFLFAHKLELGNAARAGARWGATHSSSWSAAASPASNTIEGQVQAAGGTSGLSNDDSHVDIEYYALSGATATNCGRFSAASAGFVAQGGYTQSTCVVPGSLIKVTLTNSYSLVTGLLGGAFGASASLKGVAAFVVMK